MFNSSHVSAQCREMKSQFRSNLSWLLAKQHAFLRRIKRTNEQKNKCNYDAVITLFANSNSINVISANLNKKKCLFHHKLAPFVVLTHLIFCLRKFNYWQIHPPFTHITDNLQAYINAKLHISFSTNLQQASLGEIFSKIIISIK